MKELLRKFKKLLIAYYRLSRIKVIIFDYFWILSIISIVASGFAVLQKDVLIALFVCLLVHVYAFIVNDCEDAEDDAMDEKKAKRNPISSGFITYKQGILLLQLTFVPAIVISFLAHGLPAAIIILSALLAGHFYSWKPIRFKSMPVIDLISHAYALGMFQIIYFMLLPNASAGLPSYAILSGIGLFSMAGSFYNQVRDFDIDVKSNLRNTAITIGKNKAQILSVIFYVAAVLLIISGVALRLIASI